MPSIALAADITSAAAVPEGYIVDFVSGSRFVRDTPREQVRQRLAHAIVLEYGFDIDDIELDFPLLIAGRTKRLDLVVFVPGSKHVAKNISRVALCRPEPKLGRASVRIRDYDQAGLELDELRGVMGNLPTAEFGLWTNGLEFYYLRRGSATEDNYEPVGDWPPCHVAYTNAGPPVLRRADAQMLRTAFRRCHNFIHGNEGMPKDAAFWQFLYLIFCKMHDERAARDDRRFWAGPQEQFTPIGRANVRARVESLFAEVKKTYRAVFRGNEEITLSDRALSFMVSELGRYDFLSTSLDVKGTAYQEIVGTNLRGDRGQYFTPRAVIRLMIDLIDPSESEPLLDPACGTGGFLVGALDYLLDRLRAEQSVPSPLADELAERIRQYATSSLFGCDFDPFLIRASQMNMVMAGDGKSHLYHLNSLEFPTGHLPDVSRADRDIPLGTAHIIVTNPPFGADIPITDPAILRQYDLAHRWVETPSGFQRTKELQKTVAPEILFVERCLQWLRPGGRAAIVLPDGVLGNPALKYVRAWLLEHAWIIASVDLPVEAFIAEANVNILTSILLLRKKDPTLRMGDCPSSYPVFMAVAENVGVDRRGNPLFRRNAAGDELLETVEEVVSLGPGRPSRRVVKRVRVPDDDLPAIALAFREWRASAAHGNPHLIYGNLNSHI